VALRDGGYREITLLGQTVNSYGKKLQPPVSFAALLTRIDAALGREVRVRFTTSHPTDVTPELAEAIATLPSVCEHMHLPVQAGSDRTLERMERGYGREEYLRAVAMLRAAVPELAITTDIIVGFPGESEAEFAQTLRLMEAVGFDGCFAFKFSARGGTLAATLPEQVPEDVKAVRLTRVFELQNRLSLARNQALLGGHAQILVDRGLQKREAGLVAGRTRQNKIVHCQAAAEIPEGSLINVEITGATPHHLKGILIPSP
jgi:tRNA-2-methylthio-N6-dimethylallyladenosine synthase